MLHICVITQNMEGIEPSIISNLWYWPHRIYVIEFTSQQVRKTNQEFVNTLNQQSLYFVAPILDADITYLQEKTGSNAKVCEEKKKYFNIIMIVIKHQNKPEDHEVN